MDLGLRITKKGYVFKCSKDGLVYHSKKTWIPVKAMFKRLWHYGAANYYLAVKHPDYTMRIMPSIVAQLSRQKSKIFIMN